MCCNKEVIIMVNDYRKTVDFSNLSLTEGNGHWCASWERNGRKFNTDELYGCMHKRSFAQLKSIMENDQGIPIPAEIAVKSASKVNYELGRKTYVIDEKLLGIEGNAHKSQPRDVNRGYGR